MYLYIYIYIYIKKSSDISSGHLKEFVSPPNKLCIIL